jgi:SAM-dependent methyltransferase
MATIDAGNAFRGSVPLVYERYLVPLIFQPYADDMGARVTAAAPRRVLEIAAGTGVLTRVLAEWLPQSSHIVATDLSDAMLQVAQTLGTAQPVTWQQADAMQLPFPDGSVDAVVCQFGAMFFPDKARAFAEARRVLAPGGRLFLNVWDRIETNDFTCVVSEAVARLFPDDPPGFLEQTPHGYHDVAAIRHDLAAGGFDAQVTIETVTLRCRAASPSVPAIAFCQGTPLRNEIEARRGATLVEATEVATRAIEARFGEGTFGIEGRIQAHVVSAAKP